MRLIDADWLLSFIRLDEKVIAPEQHTAQDIIMMVQAAPTIEPPPNDPLTLEELLKMDGEPIWVVFEGMNVNPSWYIVNTKCEEAANKNGGFVSMVYYGYTWLAYRRKPEEV